MSIPPVEMRILMLHSTGVEPARGTYCLLVDKNTGIVIKGSVIGYILLPTAYPISILQVKHFNDGKIILKNELKIL